MVYWVRWHVTYPSMWGPGVHTPPDKGGTPMVFSPPKVWVRVPSTLSCDLHRHPAPPLTLNAV